MPDDLFRKKQDGSAIILVLLSIGLFAALAFTFMRGSEQGQGNLTGNQARIAAQTIINYSSSLERVINKLRSKGCSESEISFQHAQNTGYTIASTREECKIFSSSGGQLVWTKPESNWLNNTYSGTSNFGDYFFTGANIVPNNGLGTAGAGNDLVLLLLYLPLEACLAINDILGVPNTSGAPPSEGTNVSILKFQGVFTSSPGTLWDANTGFRSACLKASDATPPANTYFYFSVLLER